MNCQNRISLKIKLLSIAFRKSVSQAVGDLNLTAAQSSVLGFICERGGGEAPIYAKTIEEAFHMKHPTVTGILQRLEEKGFITVQPDPADKRYKRISATEVSMENHNAAKKMIDEKEAELLSCLTSAERAELDRLLNKILENTVHC